MFLVVGIHSARRRYYLCVMHSSSGNVFVHRQVYTSHSAIVEACDAVAALIKGGISCNPDAWSRKFDTFPKGDFACITPARKPTGQLALALEAA